MRRFWVVIASAALVAGVGCGRKSYEERLTKTVEKLDYDRRLAKNLMKAPDDKRFKDAAIYVRAPKEEELAKTCLLPVSEGQFDLESSFVDAKDSNSALHVLARVKQVKKAATKGAAPVAAPPPRGDFIGEVVGTLSSVFNSPEVLQNTPKFSEESHKGGNRFKRLIFTANDKEVKVYTLKQGNHEVALIFVYDAKQKNLISSKIEYCLDSFAIADKATRLYSGGLEEEPEGTAPGPI